jgi:hypothetical protein
MINEWIGREATLQEILLEMVRAHEAGDEALVVQIGGNLLALYLLACSEAEDTLAHAQEISAEHWAAELVHEHYRRAPERHRQIALAAVRRGYEGALEWLRDRAAAERSAEDWEDHPSILDGYDEVE